MANKHIIHKFEGIYRENIDPLFRFIRFRISDREEAIDLTEEVFFRLLREMEKGKVKHPRAFIYRVARNLVIDWYRKEKSLPMKPFSDQENEEEVFVDMFESQLPSAEVTAEANRAIDAIKKLPPLYRESVYLRLVEELSPKEIADILNESANTISVRINRGFAELHKMFEKE
ncbi:MAG TPA: RNA polymerase sigma factor [Candidatus Paceibacterota bacterium]|nr:RNA polymerase sigma factor [Candidatus Paceibacterota bacterium]